MRSLSVGLTLVAVALVGVAMLVVGWHHVAGLDEVGLQLPWLVSCGLAAVTVAGAALAVLALHLERRDRAVTRAMTGELCDALARAIAQVAAEKLAD